jgi:hypothetical protein
MLRKMLLALGAAALLAALPASAGDRPSFVRGGTATPNFLGTTGLLFTPSAYVVGDRGIALGVHGHSDFETYSGLVGITDRLEAGITYLNGDDDFGGDGVIGNVKFQALKETTVLPAISVGLVDAFDQLDRGVGWYVVGSKDLSRIIPLRILPIRVHAGVGGGVYDNEFFAGVEANIATPFDTLPIVRPVFSVVAETLDGDVNLGLRARFRGFAATVGLFDFDNFGAGITYTTGLRLW